ncbi:hypothetical protein [Leptospira interrogans]|nr:hypothetical protein [Leptospira interrogans]
MRNAAEDACLEGVTSIQRACASLVAYSSIEGTNEVRRWAEGF